MIFRKPKEEAEQTDQPAQRDTPKIPSPTVITRGTTTRLFFRHQKELWRQLKALGKQ